MKENATENHEERKNVNDFKKKKERIYLFILHRLNNLDFLIQHQ